MAGGALKVGELARQTGLTVRTLHHYDQIGLLKPSLHTGSGHRLYATSDVARLQQIVSLRALGFSLEEIGRCLNHPDFSPLELTLQHLGKVKQQRELLRQLCERLEVLIAHMQAAAEASAEDFLRIIEVVTKMDELYTPEQMKQFAEAGRLVGQEEIQAVQEGWLALLPEVQANRHLDPSCPEAQALFDRWEALTERTMRGFKPFAGLPEAIGNNYKQGKFEGVPGAPQAADFAFMEKVKAAREAQK